MGKYTYAFLLQNDSTVTSQCMKFIFGDEKEVYLLDKSVLPVTEKKVCEREKRGSALGWNMDMQTLVHFALIQTNGSAYYDGVILQGAK